LYQDLVRADRSHAVINTVAAALRVAFDVIQRRWVDHCPRRPWSAIHRSHSRDDLRLDRGVWAESAKWLFTALSVCSVPGDNPGARDRVFAEFHHLKKTPLHS